MSELTLQQVSYRYPGGSRYALDGISGTFSAGLAAPTRSTA